MAGEFDFLDKVWEEIEKEASKKGSRLHASAKLELENYTLRRGIRKLPEKTRAAIVKEVGTASIDEAAGQDLGAINAGVVRGYLVRKCRDDFRACYRAAIDVVKKVGQPSELAELEHLDRSGE